MTTLRRSINLLLFVLLVGPTTAWADDLPRAVLRTDMGDITVELYPDIAPKAVENFLTHARNGYYDGVVFHRVEREFVIQTGDPISRGYGGKSIWGSPFENEIDPSVGFDEPYMLGMANRGVDGTNHSQFFFNLAPTPWMNGSYTLFGRVIDGTDAVDAISEVDVEITEKRPIRDVVVQTIEVLDDGASE